MPGILWLALIPPAAAALATVAALAFARSKAKLAAVFVGVCVLLFGGGYCWLQSIRLPGPRFEGYVRVSKEDGVMKFQSARRSFTNQKTGDKIALIGICHIGEPSYYREMFGELLKYDHILFEGVVPVAESREVAPDKEPDEKKPGPADFVPKYSELSALMGLESQQEHISANQPGWLWCDVTTLDIEKEMRKRGIDPATMTAGNDAATKDLMIEAMKAENLWRLLKILKDTGMRTQAQILRRYLETRDINKVRRMLLFVF